MTDRDHYIDVLKKIVNAKKKYYPEDEDMPITISYQAVKDILKLLKEQQPVKPVKTCKSKNELGVNGILITGLCPECDQRINNRGNKFCGGCGRPVIWDA